MVVPSRIYLIFVFCFLFFCFAGRIKKMMADLDVLANFVKANFPNDANMPDLQVFAAASSAACPAGKVMMIAPGNNSELERTVCGKYCLGMM